MIDSVLAGIIILLVWIGLWGLIDMSIETIADGSKSIRAISYALLAMVGLFMLWIYEISLY